MDFIYDAIRHLAQQGVQGGFMPDSFKYAFVINAVICAVLIGPTLGAIGTVVVAKRMAFFSNAIGNSALTGIAIGILLGEPVNNPYICLFSFAVLFAIYLNFSKNKSGMSHDTLIGVFLSASLAIGAALMMFATRNINIHILDNYMFGSILTAGNSDITLLLLITVLSIAAGIYGFNRTIMSGLNPSLAQVRGVAVSVYDYVFVVLIAMITVASVKIVGSILVEALLIIPAAAARNISKSLKTFVLFSVIFATISALTGIIIPMEYNIPIPSGAAIIVVATIIFILTLSVKIVRKN